MRIVRFAILLLASIPIAVTSVAQQSPGNNAQAIKLLQLARAALNPGPPTTDVTLSGSAHLIAGSDDGTGTVVLKAVTGASRVDISLPSGPRSEIENGYANGTGVAPSGTWSGPDGVVHTISLHNLLTDPVWFFPVFPIAHGLSDYVVNYVGQESRDGHMVEHLTISQTDNLPTSKRAPTITHLSEMDFFLDSTTFLPTAITFYIHPDNNALLDIPIEADFSDYRSINGALVPYHVQKFVNNNLYLDLQFETAALNTGLVVNQFQATVN